MSFRRRMVLLAAAAVAAAVVLASVVVYVVTGDELRGQIDASLRQKLTPGQPQAVRVKTTKLSAVERARLERATAELARASKKLGPDAQIGVGAAVGAEAKPSPGAANAHFQGRVVPRSGAMRATGGSTSAHGSSTAPVPPAGLALLGGGPNRLGAGLGLFSSVRRSRDGTVTAVSVVLPPQAFGGASGYAQLVQAGGQVLRSGGPGRALPVTQAVRAVAAGRRAAFFSDATIGGTRVRVLTSPAPGGAVWQVALPLSDVNSTLRHLLWVLAAVSLGGVLLAAALGLLVSRAALVPVRRLMGATERVARTQDLAHRIPAGEQDELGRLAGSFNTMLAALERSRLAQRQLISDASHELRTPLTSVQANLDALALGHELAPRERARVVAAAQGQLQELTVLVGDLVDLSKTEVQDVELEDVRLDLVVAAAVERARLRAPGCPVTLDAVPCMVRAAPARLDRAIVNLLDNAIKWNPPSPPAGPVQALVRDGRVEVRDRGPGIAAEDLPRVFDRFYRAPAARAHPGSGLGLAIVRQVAETHGGAVHAANDPEGGARLTLELPSLPMSAAEMSFAAAAAGTLPAAADLLP
jgi:two-component system, OmpR family, sensor histidine kinase MprB